MLGSYSHAVVIGLAGVLLFGASGCVEYVSAPSRYSEFSSRIKVDLPKGWLQHTKAKGGYTITKDGLRLEKIVIKTTRVDEKIEGTDRVYTGDMLPHEAADLSVGLIKARPEMRGFEVQKIDATQIAGRDGYRVDATYVDEGGLHKRMRICGTVAGKYVYELVYEAAETVYFQKYREVFEGVVSSVRIGR